ncbi:MAG: flagellar basal body L-ring protein FlgH [Planctomycetaceae bacterium]|nr:flagellar basal body L-ring protein FlgH [Planctomycetaceae bacterium]
MFKPVVQFLLVIGCCHVTTAEDLWECRHPDRAFLFVDSQARHVGDLLTVLISEDTDVDQRDDRALSKSAGSGGTFELSGEAGGALGSQAADAGLDFSGSTNRNFDGSASYRSARQITDRITLTVQEVLPNGNLVLSGIRQIEVGRDQRDLLVSGVVRPIDINPDNTVHSRFVSNLSVSYSEQGPASRFTNQGWLSRITNRVWPF